MNKPVCLSLSILEISKIVLCGFSYDYVKLKYREKAKLSYMDTESFVVYKKREDIYSDIVKDAETRFDTYNYELNHCLKLDGKKLKNLLHKEQKHSYLIDNNNEDKRYKNQKKYVVKKKLHLKIINTV